MANLKHINKANFEEVYQDFLDGRLDEKQSEELFCFMEAHMEWMEQTHGTFILNPITEDTLNEPFKQGLLQLNYEEEPIHSNNIHTFLYAQIEGLLSKNESEKVVNFLIQHPDFQKDFELLKSTKLNADSTLTFPNPARLKQKQTRILWPTLAAAACLAGLILYTLNWDTKSLNVSAVTNYIKNQQDSSSIQLSEKQIDSIKTENYFTEHFEKEYAYFGSQSPILDSINRISTPPSSIDTSLINSKEDHLESPQITLKKPVEVLISSTTELPMVKSFNSHTTAMNNPIHPITSGLSYLTQQEIDFRMASRESSKKGRYFLKLGKLEILHIEN